MSGGAISGAVLAGVGTALNAAGGPISSGINARMYKKYGLHEPEYRAASLRKAGINPIVAESGSLPSPPDLGFDINTHPELAVSTALENKQRKGELAILKQKAEQAVNENAISSQQLRVSGMAADLMEKLGYDEKKAALSLTSATAAKYNAEAELLRRQEAAAIADEKFWKDLNNLGDGEASNALKFLLKLKRGQ